MERTCGRQQKPSAGVCFATHTLLRVGLGQPVIAWPSNLQPASSRCGTYKRAAVLRRPVCADWNMLICSNFHHESTSDDPEWRLQQPERGRSHFSYAVLSITNSAWPRDVCTAFCVGSGTVSSFAKAFAMLVALDRFAVETPDNDETAIVIEVAMCVICACRHGRRD